MSWTRLTIQHTSLLSTSQQQSLLEGISARSRLPSCHGDPTPWDSTPSSKWGPFLPWGLCTFLPWGLHTFHTWGRGPYSCSHSSLKKVIITKKKSKCPHENNSLYLWCVCQASEKEFEKAIKERGEEKTTVIKEFNLEQSADCTYNISVCLSGNEMKHGGTHAGQVI